MGISIALVKHEVFIDVWKEFFSLSTFFLKKELLIIIIPASHSIDSIELIIVFSGNIPARRQANN